VNQQVKLRILYSSPTGTYIHVYNRSIEQLNQYFNQPLLNNYLLSAERIIGAMAKSNRDQAYKAVVQQLLDSSSNTTLNKRDDTKKGVAKAVVLARRSKRTGAKNGEVAQRSPGEVADNIVQQATR